MNELDLQDKYLVNFFCERADGLQYNEAKANTVSAQFFINEDFKHFISETSLNKDNYKKLLKKFQRQSYKQEINHLNLVKLKISYLLISKCVVE